MVILIFRSLPFVKYLFEVNKYDTTNMVMTNSYSLAIIEGAVLTKSNTEHSFELFIYIKHLKITFWCKSTFHETKF